MSDNKPRVDNARFIRLSDNRFVMVGSIVGKTVASKIIIFNNKEGVKTPIMLSNEAYYALTQLLSDLDAGEAGFFNVEAPPESNTILEWRVVDVTTDIKQQVKSGDT